MLERAKRRARPMDLGPAGAPIVENLRTPDQLWIEPMPDGLVVPDGDPAEIVAGTRVGAARVRRCAAAAAAAPAGRPDPLRGAALEGVRGGRAARDERRLGEQRAAARTRHARGERADAVDDGALGRRRGRGAPRALRRGVRAVRHGRAHGADPRGRDAVDAAVRPLARGARRHPHLVVRPGQRLPRLARHPRARRRTARRRSASTSRPRPARATSRGRCRCSRSRTAGSSSSRSSSTRDGCSRSSACRS